MPFYICGSQQDEVTEDDIDDSFKSMFAQLAGEVTPVFLFGNFVRICKYYLQILFNFLFNVGSGNIVVFLI